MSQGRAEVPPRLRRDVGLLPLFMVSAGSVVGSGWLIGTFLALRSAGPAAIISWIIAVILLMGIALIYAELGAAYPVSGGTARFTWIHAGTLGGFCCGTYAGYLGPAGRLRPWRPPPAGRR
jgi:amino acid transporter